MNPETIPSTKITLKIDHRYKCKMQNYKTSRNIRKKSK